MTRFTKHSKTNAPLGLLNDSAASICKCHSIASRQSLVLSDQPSSICCCLTIAAGFKPDELKAVNFGVAELREAGFDAIQLRALGFTAAELKAYGKSVIARGQKKQIALDEKMARKKQEKLQFGQMIKDQAAELLSKRDTERKEKYGGDIVNLGDYVDTVGGSRFFVHAKVPPSYYESQGGLKQFSGDPPGYMYKDPWPRIVVSFKVVCFQHLQSHV